jgi:catechol 2,3-dioxygenase
MPSTRTRSIDPAAHIGPVHLTVTELDRSITFYREVIGLELLGRRDATAALGAGGAPLLILTGLPSALPHPRRTTGLYHVAILMPTRRDLARSLQALVDSQYPVQGASDHLVSEAIYLADPDGNGLELYADRPRASWPVFNQQVSMASDALDLRGLLGELGSEAAQTPFNVDPATTVGHIHLRVADLADTERFYAQGLGFDVTQRSYPGALFLSAGGYHHHIGANVWGSASGTPPPADTVGLRHYTIVVPTGAGVDAFMADAIAAGVKAERRDSKWWTADPSSNRVVLTDRVPTVDDEIGIAIAGTATSQWR